MEEVGSIGMLSHVLVERRIVVRVSLSERDQQSKETHAKEGAAKRMNCLIDGISSEVRVLDLMNAHQTDCWN